MKTNYIESNPDIVMMNYRIEAFLIKIGVLGKNGEDNIVQKEGKMKKKDKRIKLPKKPICPKWYPCSYNHTIIIPWSKPTYTYNGEFKV